MTSLIEINAVVASELWLFPRGARGSGENLFRSVYQMVRANSLGRKAERTGAGACLRSAVEIVLQYEPQLEPVVVLS